MRHLLRLVALLALGAPLVAPLGAQLPDGQPRRVSGRIVRPGARALQGVPNVWAVLHRVAPDSAAPIDSVRTNASGAYEMAYRGTGSDSVVYFVSAMHGGIAYFTPPLRGTVVRGEAAEITVFDTTSRGVALAVRGRHFVLSAAGEAGARTVIEVFEIANDSAVTFVTPASDAASTWSTVLPQGAADFRVGQGDVAQDAVTAGGGRVRVFAPFAPGIKQLSFSYVVPANAFPLVVPLETGIDVLEVLLEETTGHADGAGLTEVNPVQVSGRMFQRFLAQDVPAPAVMRITVPPPPRALRPLYMLGVVAVLGAGMLVTLARAFARRAERGTRGTPGATRLRADAERLARQIADLDAAFERQRDPGDDARDAYRVRRDELKRELTDVLARADGAA